MAEQEQDRTEQATPFKLKEAKKRGQVPKSLEVNSWFVMASLLMALYIWGDSMIRQLGHMNRAIFSYSGKLSYSPDVLLSWLGDVFFSAASVITPIILLIMIIAVLMNFFQTGPVFSFFPLKPDFNKINPVTGFKRIFSIRTVYETIKSLIKLALFGSIVYFFIVGLLPTLLGFMNVDPDAYPYLFLRKVESLLLQLIGLLFIIAAIDMVYSRRDFSEKMKMSQREVKEEHKRREGDPEVRAKIKELQREASKRAQSLSRVPEADVLITNPTHRSVAVKYDRKVMDAPQVIAKGAGDLALKMRQVAKDKNVPIIEHKPLARALFKEVAIDQEIPATFYVQLAKILVRISGGSRFAKSY
jgi:flagellar biosynthesis protein FlhB